MLFEIVLKNKTFNACIKGIPKIKFINIIVIITHEQVGRSALKTSEYEATLNLEMI